MFGGTQCPPSQAVQGAVQGAETVSLTQTYSLMMNPAKHSSLLNTWMLTRILTAHPRNYYQLLVDGSEIKNYYSIQV